MIIELRDIIIKPQPRGRNAGRHVYYPAGWDRYMSGMQTLIKAQAMKQKQDIDLLRPLSIALLYRKDSLLISMQNINWMPSEKNGDLDNYDKMVIDAVSQALDFNDKNIFQIMSCWR